MEYTIQAMEAAFRQQLRYTSTAMVRGAMEDIDWQARLIGIKGARGVGKTTLLLQYIKLHHAQELRHTLYVSLDTLWFAQHGLVELAETFAQKGGRYLFLDEVHKYPHWSQELKNCYDQFPQLKIVFTGSSLLEIQNARADLSRRAVVYTLPGLSFREFVQLEKALSLPRYTLSELLLHHEQITEDLVAKFSPLTHFSDYLRLGYYPFYREKDQSYFRKLQAVVHAVLEMELPLLRGVEPAYVHRLKQLLNIIAQGAPFVPNVSKLSAKIGMERSTLLRYLHYLDEVKLTRNLFKKAEGISQLQKPQKIYLENPNLMHTLAEQVVGQGALRETFFANQVGALHRLQYPARGDFWVDGRYYFEVGGKHKTAQQIHDLEEGYVAADGIEYGWGRKIPLWLFGFLY